VRLCFKLLSRPQSGKGVTVFAIMTRKSLNEANC
jgi:hypothetical protein